MRRVGLPVFAVIAVLAIWRATDVRGEWDPDNGAWGKVAPEDLRVMTWNVQDAIRTGVDKVEGVNSWDAVVRIVASMKPDVLILQEVGDNGCYNCVDSVSELNTVFDLFFYGGTDPFQGGQVTSYAQLYDPGYELAHIFVSTVTDGYNRNVILSRFEFADLNGDGRGELSDLYNISADEYAPGGRGGIRGFMFGEIDLPDATYLGDLAIGNGHLKSGSGSDDKAQRLEASQNVAYFIDYWFNGAGAGVPDPHSKIADVFNPADNILEANTPVIFGGDWNEDEQYNGRKGPAEWLSRAEYTGGTDGTDRDRTDSTFDNALHYFDNNRRTHSSGSKLDYLAWQDSIATERLSFVFNTAGTPRALWPEELETWGSSFILPSVTASDHYPVIVDFILPLGSPPTGACCTAGECTDDVTESDCTDAGGEYQGDDTNCATVTCPAVGACCTLGVCEDLLTESDCTDGGGEYQGNDTDCGTVTCPGVGACCTLGVCEDLLTEAECTAGGGEYQGDGTDCGSVTCPQPSGACCTNGACTDGVTAEDCTSGGGVYQGNDTTCATVECAETIAINEIRIDEPDLDTNEYFEIVGPPGAGLDGLTYLVLGDNGVGGSGVIEALIDLDGQTIPADGFFLAAEDTFTLAGATPDLVLSSASNELSFENSDNVTHLLVRGFSGLIDDDLDSDDDGVLDVEPWADIVDLIAVIEEDNPPVSTEFHYGPPIVGPDDGSVPGHVYRCPDFDGMWLMGELDPSLSFDTPGLANECCASPAECDDGVDCTADDCVNAQCVNTPDDSVCEDEWFCNGLETCDPQLDCLPGAPPCEGLVCDEEGDRCVECLDAGDCDDKNVCTYDGCLNEVCSNTPRLYGDINGDGTPNVFDIFCILDLIAGNPVGPECNLVNADIEPCIREGEPATPNVFDVFGVLDAIAGINTCGCPLGP